MGVPAQFAILWHISMETILRKNLMETILWKFWYGHVCGPFYGMREQFFDFLCMALTNDNGFWGGAQHQAKAGSLRLSVANE